LNLCRSRAARSKVKINLMLILPGNVLGYSWIARIAAGCGTWRER
jgi:hypothetical protein